VYANIEQQQFGFKHTNGIVMILQPTNYPALICNSLMTASWWMTMLTHPKKMMTIYILFNSEKIHLQESKPLLSITTNSANTVGSRHSIFYHAHISYHPAISHVLFRIEIKKAKNSKVFII